MGILYTLCALALIATTTGVMSYLTSKDYGVPNLLYVYEDATNKIFVASLLSTLILCVVALFGHLEPSRAGQYACIPLVGILLTLVVLAGKNRPDFEY